MLVVCSQLQEVQRDISSEVDALQKSVTERKIHPTETLSAPVFQNPAIPPSGAD